MLVLKGSSKIYKACNEGKAIIIKIKIGKTVQKISVVCSCNICKSLIFIIEINNIFRITKIVIADKITIVKSWNLISWYIEGEALSWKLSIFHVGILKGIYLK